MLKLPFNLTEKEYLFLRELNSPKGIQDFVDKIPYNQEKKKETCYSPRQVIEKNTANCIEGAIFAAAALRINGYSPLIMDLEAEPNLDDDHVIAVFQMRELWGAIGKSKFTGLTYRNPIYRSPRELAISYFEDFFNEDGKMSLRRYSDPVNLEIFDSKNWITSKKPLWYIPNHLCNIKHKKIIPDDIPLRDATHKILRAGMLYYPKGYKRH